MIFYGLVITGLTFFAMGVASTLMNSFRLQKEYEVMTTELVRTDTALRELEVKYTESRNELKTFKLRIESSETWTKDEMGQTHGELEKMRAEYVRVKVSADNQKVFDSQKMQEQMRRLLTETEEYNKLLAERNKELNNLKSVFENMKIQLENNQKALAETHEHLRSLQSLTDTRQKMKDAITQLEDLRNNAQGRGTEEKKDGPSEMGSMKEHLDTMKSFLSSLEKKSGEEKLVY